MMSVRLVGLAGLAIEALCGCSGSSSGAALVAPVPSAEATETAASATARTSASPSGTESIPSSPPTASVRWAVTYKSAPGTLSIPASWKNVEWHPIETAAGLGDGAIVLAVDGASGRVSGTIDGPLGPATLDGFVAGTTLNATVRRKDPSDHGFAGTLSGAVADGHASGTIHVTLAEASALRSATFEMSPTH
jgi:hypothetical protein